MSGRSPEAAAAAAWEVPAYGRLARTFVRGEGSLLWDAEGREHLDLYGGHAVAVLGHSPPAVVEALSRQARELLFYSNLVELPARARAAERLGRLGPWDGGGRVFFCNSGTEANETALKMARQATGRRVVVSFRGGFHGRTLGAVAACGMEKYSAAARGVVDPTAFRLADLEEPDAWPSIIDETVAAVIIEPVQSMGGVRVLGDRARALREACTNAGAWLVFDEVQTAPARTGAWFAGGNWDVVPDAISMAKAIAGGVPAAAVLTSPNAAGTVKPGDQGTTFGGGPLACAAVDATLAALQEIDAPARARAIERQVREGLRDVPGVREVRGLGGLLGVAVDDAATVRRRLLEEHAVLVGDCPGDPTVLRLLPPLTMTEDEVARGLAALRSVLA